MLKHTEEQASAGSPPAYSSEAEELLSRRLYEKMEHLCPTDDHCDWARLSEKDKEYYRTLIENLLMADDLVKAALLG